MSDLLPRRLFIHRMLSFTALSGASGGTAFARAGVAASKRLTIERVEIELPNLPAGLDGFRIAQLSDLHLEPWTTEEQIDQAVQACNELKPDLVALTGDFVTDNTRAAEPLAALLARLEAPHGVFATLGNHDFWSGAQDVESALAGRKIPVLRNEIRRIHTDRGVLHLAGTDSVYAAQPNIRKTFAEWRNNQPLVLLMHEPDAADLFAEAGVTALQLSGHTHGGQLRFMGKDPAAMRRARWGKKYLAGQYQVGPVQLYVNRGVGCVGVPMRIGCPPEVTEVTLRSPEVRMTQRRQKA